jgi:hypothetical protein
MTNACKKCIHVNICKFKEEYSLLAIDYSWKEVKSPFTLSLLCEHYESQERGQLIDMHWFSPINLVIQD